MNWKAFLGKVTPALPWAAIVAALVGWFASYTHAQRQIGALNADVAAGRAIVALQADSTKHFKALADRSTHAADSLDAILVGFRARAATSDSSAHVLADSYRQLRDRVLAPAPAADGSAVPVPTMPQLIASADAAIAACQFASADCKKRGDVEQLRGDSARAAAMERGREAKAAEMALAASEKNNKKLEAAMPSTIGNTLRAGYWAGIGGGVMYFACRLFHCQ